MSSLLFINLNATDYHIILIGHSLFVYQGWAFDSTENIHSVLQITRKTSPNA